MNSPSSVPVPDSTPGTGTVTSPDGRPCSCWTETWSQHDGHCCFAPTSPEDCHDTEAAQQERNRRRTQNDQAWTGPVMDRRYWLTEKGWAATGGIPA